MPTVPSLVAPSVSLQALPTGGLKTPATNDGAKLAGQIADFGGKVNDIALREQGAENESAILQTENWMDAQRREFQTKNANRVGFAAKGLQADTEKFWDETFAKASSGLSPAQQLLLAERSGSRRNAIVETAANYEQQQVFKARDDQREADNANTIEFASLVPGPARTLDARTKVEANARGWANQRGLDLNDPAQAAQFEDYKRKQLIALHGATLATLTSDPTKAAEADEYLKTWRHEMGAELGARAAKVVEEQGRGVTAQAEVDRLRATFKGDLSGAINAAREKYAPKDQALENEIITRLTHAATVDEAAIKEARRGADERALRLYAESGGNYASIPPALRASMSPDLVARLALNTKDQQRMDRQTFDNMRVLAYTNPEAFLGMDLNDPALFLTPTYRAQAAALHSQIQKQGDARAVEQQHVFIGAAFDNRMASAGETDPKKLKALRTQFDKVYAADVEQFRVKNNRMPTNAEAAQIAGKLLIYGEYDGWVNKDGFVFQHNSYPDKPFIFPSNNEYTQTMGEAFLTGTGQEVTPEGMATYQQYRNRAIDYLTAKKQPFNEASVAALVTLYDRNARTGK